MEVLKKQPFEQKDGWSVLNIFSWFARLGFAFYRATDVDKRDSEQFSRKSSVGKKQLTPRLSSRRLRKHEKQQLRRAFDIQKWICKLGFEFHPIGYKYLGPRTKEKKGVKVKNRLDRLARQHDVAYGKAKNIRDKWKADRIMIAKINNFKGSKSILEMTTKKILQTKLFLRM